MKRSPPRTGAKSDPYGTDSSRANAYAGGIGGVFLLVGYMIGYMKGLSGWAMVVTVLGTGIAAGISIKVLSLAIAGATGDAVMHALQPSGASTPYQPQYSYQDAMVAKGDIAGAVESYEKLLVDDAGDFEARSRVADLYARHLSQPRKAAEHFLAVQRAADVTPERMIYASNRLVDLYMGPLDDQGRALVELRKIIDRYPGSAVGEQARAALMKIKQSMPRA